MVVITFPFSRVLYYPFLHLFIEVLRLLDFIFYQQVSYHLSFLIFCHLLSVIVFNLA